MSSSAVPAKPKRRPPLTLRAYWLTLSLAFQADRFGAALLCLSTPALYLAPAAGAVATKLLVDAATVGRLTVVAWAGLFAGLSVLATLAAMQLSIYLVHAINMKVDVLVERRLAEMLVRLPGIEHYERADHLNEVQQLRNQSGYIGAGLNATVQTLGHLLQVVVVLALLAAQTPLLLLLPLFAVPSFIAATRSNRMNRHAQEQTAEPDRLLHRIVGLVADLPVAREARLFGLGDYLRARRQQLADTIDRIQGKAVVGSTLLVLAGDLVFAIGYFGAILLVLSRALRGELTAGDVALIVVLGGQVRGFLTGVVRGVQFIAAVYIVAARMDWLQAYEKTQRPTGEPVPVPARVSHGIRLDRVSFRYPGTEPIVLDDVSLELPASAVVALVGDNGAGKTTLVKLLLRYYLPTSGRILVDHIDLADVDPTEWRQRSSGAFQDFCNFEFLARESIGLGDIARINDNRAVLAATERGHATPVIDTLPHGLETQLGAGWEGGIDLSGGQWQRLALARSRMREHPLLLVLDEPTAALDAQVEHQLFQGFAAAARDARRTGGITLLVTHRFSTVRMADLIFVLADGRVRESGSHHDLMRLGGLYAELFELQASAYR